jgi:Protein of unknown function
MMTRDQAEEIQRHLLDAADAINRADQIIINLDAEDRKRLAGPLGATVDALHFELLKAVYDEYPELRPPGETPVISSSLRWEDVSLPPSVSEADLDAVIFAQLRPLSRKMALVIGNVVSRCNELGLPVSDEIIGARLTALAEADRIEGLGDLRKWRHSEVRLKS